MAPRQPYPGRLNLTAPARPFFLASRSPEASLTAASGPARAPPRGPPISDSTFEPARPLEHHDDIARVASEEISSSCRLCRHLHINGSRGPPREVRWRRPDMVPPARLWRYGCLRVRFSGNAAMTHVSIGWRRISARKSRTRCWTLSGFSVRRHSVCCRHTGARLWITCFKRHRRCVMSSTEDAPTD